jgi:predicted  nucleic acid-binding Zn-ribbon protein
MDKAAKQARSFGIEPENFERFQELQGIAHAIGAILGNMVHETEEFDKAASSSKRTIADLKGEVSKLQEKIEGSFDAREISVYNEEIRYLQRSIAGLMGELKPDISPSEPMFDLDEALGEVDKSMASLLSQTEDFQEFFDVATIGRMSQAMAELEYQLARASDPEKQRELRQEIARLKKEIDGIRTGAGDAGDSLQYFSRTLADGLDQILFRARSVEDAIQGIVRQLASRAFTTGIMGLLGGASFGGLSGFAAAAFGGTFHTGGIVPGVGEKMINVQGGEMVLSRDQVKTMGSGSTKDIRLTINIRGDLQGRGDTLRAVIDEQVRQSVRLS